MFSFRKALKDYRKMRMLPVTVRLPLTLSILDGQLARTGDQRFVVPLVSIIESVQVPQA